MKNSWRPVVILAAVVISLAVIMIIGFYLLQREPDLTGGTRLLVQVVTDDVLEQELVQDAARIGRELQSRGIVFAASGKGANYSVDISGVEPGRDSDVRSLCDQLYPQKYVVRSTAAEGRTSYSLSLPPDYIRQVRESTVNQAAEAIRRRLNALGIRGPAVLPAGKNVNGVQDQLVIEFPKVNDPERVVELITDVARLELCLVKKEQGGPFPSIEVALRANGGKVPGGYKLIPFRVEGNEPGAASYLVVELAPTITSKDMKNARPSTDSSGRPNVAFFLTAAGAEIFRRATGEHIGDRLAIVLDNVVYSAPVIESAIGAEGQITGSFTAQQAEDLALLLRSGSLPASITVLERSIISPKEKDETRSDKK